MKGADWWAKNWNNHEAVKAESKAFVEAPTHAPRQSSEQEAFESIKGISKLGGMPLSKEETIEFICTPLKLWRQNPKRQRGRPLRKDPYQLAFERRRGLYQQLVRLPSGVRRNTGVHLPALIQGLFADAETSRIPVREQVRWVSQRLTLKKIQPPDDSYLRKLRRRIIAG